MPDPTTLKVGDRVRIISIPAADQQQASAAMSLGDPFAQWTIRVLQRLADRRELVTITLVDDHGHPWFEYRFRNKRGTWEHHSLNIVDHHSWEKAER